MKNQLPSEDCGFNGHKRVKGHKRHRVVDILGELLHVRMHAAHLSETITAPSILQETAAAYPTLQAFSGDSGYRGAAVVFMNKKLN